MNRIREVRKQRKLTLAQLSKLIGCSLNMAGQLERGERRLSDKWLYPLATALNVSPAELLEPQRQAPLLLVGTVAAGKWQSADDVPDPVALTGVPLPGHINPSTPRYAYKVKGESMNELYPHGSIVICIDNVQANHDPQPGERVVVRRRRLDGTVEFTIKELMVDAAGDKWLIPRSTDPRYQTAFKAVCDDTMDGDDTAVMVATVVQHVRPPE